MSFKNGARGTVSKRGRVRNMLGSMDAKVGKEVKNKLAQLPLLEGCIWDMEQKILLVELAAKEPLAPELHSAGAHIRVLLFLLFPFCISYFRKLLNAQGFAHGQSRLQYGFKRHQEKLREHTSSGKYEIHLKLKLPQLGGVLFLISSF